MYSLMDGKERPTVSEPSPVSTEAETATQAKTNGDTTAAAAATTDAAAATTTTTLTATITKWDRANHDLYAARFLLTTGSAAQLVRPHKQGENGAHGNIQLAWQELTKKHRHKSQEKRLALLARLTETKMRPGQDTDEYVLKAQMICAELADMAKPVTDETYEDIIVRGLTKDYQQVKFALYRHPSFNIE